MICLEKYRRKLVRDINANLRRIYQGPDADAVHDFRVGIKRLSALFYFVGRIDSKLGSAKPLRPYRALYKRIGRIRDGHIAAELIGSLEHELGDDAAWLANSLTAKTARDYDALMSDPDARDGGGIRTPALGAAGISQRAALTQKPLQLDRMLQRFLQIDDTMTAKHWHRKRILLKRYHHIMDAFALCPGHTLDESELRRIRMLEQLLGDWHDRIVTIELLHELPDGGERIDRTVAVLNNQDRLLLGAARIYLRSFARWHAKNRA